MTATGLTGLKVGQSVAGASVTYTLSNGTYAASTTASDFSVTGLPAGLSIGTAMRASGTVVTATIAETPTAASAAAAPLGAPAIPAANFSNAACAITPTSSASASVVAKGDGAAMSGAPVVSGTPTTSSISVGAVTNAGTTGQGVEYAISTSATPTPAAGWQSGTTFDGLSANTDYYVFARTQASADYDAGPAQMSTAIKAAVTPPGSPISIQSQPAAETDVTVGRIAGNLSVVTTLSGSGTLSYQWYVSTTNANTGGAPIGGATNATFPIPTSLAIGTHHFFCVITAPGADTVTSAVAAVVVGNPDLAFTLSGNNQLSVLTGLSFPLSFAVKVSGNAGRTVNLTVSVNGQTGSGSFTGNGTAIVSCAPSFTAAGSHPVTVSAPGYAATNIGTVTALAVPGKLKGNLPSKLGSGYLYTRAAADVYAAIRSGSALVDDATGLMSTKNNGMLTLGIAHKGNATIIGRLVRMRSNPFAPSGKTVSDVPNLDALKVIGKINKSKKYATFSFSARSMYRLTRGDYAFMVQSAKSNSSKECKTITLATVRVLPASTVEALWSMPKSLRISVGQQYQLVSSIPGSALPELRASSSKNKVAAISTAGVLTAKRVGSATITVVAADGRKLKCAVSIVSNAYSRKKPLRLKNKAGLFVSTKKLYYSNGLLEAEVFVYNRTGHAPTGLRNASLELYDRETLIWKRPPEPIALNKALKSKRFGVLKLSISEAMLTGVEAKRLDLGSGRIQAIVRGTDIVPLIASTRDAISVKPGNARPTFTVRVPVTAGQSGASAAWADNLFGNAGYQLGLRKPRKIWRPSKTRQSRRLQVKIHIPLRLSAN